MSQNNTRDARLVGLGGYALEVCAGKGLLAELRMGHQTQTRFGLAGEAGENHGHMVTGVFVPGAGNNDAVAIYFALISW